MDAGLAAYKMTFQLSPIILTGGIAEEIPFGMLPIIAITEAINFPAGLLSSGGVDLNLDNFFANFEPIPGATLVDQSVGTYPFANQAVAANAVIANPLNISLLMTCPVRQTAGYATKLATMTALKAVLTEHNSSGGTYTVATPSGFFDDCLLLRLTDVSAGQSKQVQERWRWDFYKPLLTLQDAQKAQNNLMNKISSGVMVSGDPPSNTGLINSTGSPSNAQGPSLIPSASGAAGASVAAPNSPVD